jgi:hypothetical protein
MTGRANIAEPEYARTIRDDSDDIATIGVGKRRISISHDRAAWLGHARRVSDGEVGQIRDRHFKLSICLDSCMWQLGV